MVRILNKLTRGPYLKLTLANAAFCCRLTAGEDAPPSPLNERVGVSGTGSGAAAVVAAGLADVAVGVDHIAGLRVLPRLHHTEGS